MEYDEIFLNSKLYGLNVINVEIVTTKMTFTLNYRTCNIYLYEHITYILDCQHQV